MANKSQAKGVVIAAIAIIGFWFLTNYGDDVLEGAIDTWEAYFG